MLILVCGRLTASILEERVVTTPYYLPQEKARVDANLKSVAVYFRFPIFLNAIQFLSNALVSSLYIFVFIKGPDESPVCRPTMAVIPPMVFIALANNFGSKLGTASLVYVDYSALLVAKSCMLVPVVVLNVLILQKRYSSYRYFLFLAATLGLVLFTLQDSHTKNLAQGTSFTGEQL